MQQPIGLGRGIILTLLPKFKKGGLRTPTFLDLSRPSQVNIISNQQIILLNLN